MGDARPLIMVEAELSQIVGARLPVFTSRPDMVELKIGAGWAAISLFADKLPLSVGALVDDFFFSGTFFGTDKRAKIQSLGFNILMGHN